MKSRIIVTHYSGQIIKGDFNEVSESDVENAIETVKSDLKYISFNVDGDLVVVKGEYFKNSFITLEIIEKDIDN
jgi:hypothetical protein